MIDVLFWGLKGAPVAWTFCLQFLTIKTLDPDPEPDPDW